MNQSPLQGISQIMSTVVASGLMQSLCTIKKPPTALSPTGGRSADYDDYETVLEDVQCMDAPENFGSGIAATQDRLRDEMASKSYRHVLLDVYYPILVSTDNWGETGWLAIVDDITYAIKGAEADSQRTQTRLCLELVNV